MKFKENWKNLENIKNPPTRANKIFTEDFNKFKKTNSSQLMDELKNCGVTYSSISLFDENDDAYFSKCSNEKWLNLYFGSNFYEKCHLMLEAQNQIEHQKNGFVFLWDNYFPNNEESIYLNMLRKENNIAHGVAFCMALENGGKSILTVAGKEFDVNFSKNILRNKQPIYRAIWKSCVDINNKKQ